MKYSKILKKEWRKQNSKLSLKEFAKSVEAPTADGPGGAPLYIGKEWIKNKK